jgi:hypothetical protein
MAPQVAGVTTLKAGPYKNNSGKVLAANAAVGAPISNLTITQSLAEQPAWGAILAPAVAPTSSGNLGTQKLYNHLKFGFQQPGKYVMSKVTDSLAGSGNTVLQTMGTHFPRNPIHRFYGYQRLHITSITMQGVATKGSQAGVTVLASGTDGTTGIYADHAVPPMGVPAELTYRTGAALEKQDDYKVSTNP